MNGKNIPIQYGVITGVLLIIYFLLLSMVGLHTEPLFSLLNGVITGAGIYLSIKAYRNYKQSKFKYQKGFMAGMVTGFVATIIFTFFFGIYASNFDDNFMKELITSFETNSETSLGLLLFVVAIMGIATTFVLTLSFMQLFKESWNTKGGSRHTYSDGNHIGGANRKKAPTKKAAKN